MKKRLFALFVFVIIASMTVSGLSAAIADDEFVYLGNVKLKNSQVGWGELCIDKGLDGIMLAVYKGTRDNYNWKVKNFVAPDKKDLIIYELLLVGNSIQYFLSLSGLSASIAPS